MLKSFRKIRTTGLEGPLVQLLPETSSTFHPGEKGFWQIAQKLFQVHGLYSWCSRANRGCSCSLLAICCLMGASTKAASSRSWDANGLAGGDAWRNDPQGLTKEMHQTRPTERSILETAERAAYSLPRRKKSLSLPGDIRLRPACAWTTATGGAIESSLFALAGFKPSLPLADFVIFCSRKALTKPKAGEKAVGEGSWAFGGKA